MPHTTRAILLLAALAVACAPERDVADPQSDAAEALDSLEARLVAAVAPAGGTVGVGVTLLGTDQRVVLAAGEQFPMQSVFKLPLALTVLDAVDRGTLRLDQSTRLTPQDFVSPPQHSPLRDANPEGVEITLSDLVRAAASNSDGTAADLLLGLVGGPDSVTAHLQHLGVSGVTVAVGERAMGRDPEAQFRNWSTPEGALQLLTVLDAGAGLSAASHALLLEMLTITPTGPNRLRGSLPTGTSVAHKTGTSSTADGVTAATNDIGLITLPDGRRLAIAVFVSASPAELAVREGVIAEVARIAYEHWARQ